MTKGKETEFQGLAILGGWRFFQTWMWVPALTSLWKQDAVEGALVLSGWRNGCARRRQECPPWCFMACQAADVQSLSRCPWDQMKELPFFLASAPAGFQEWILGISGSTLWISVHRNPSYLTCPHVILPHPHVCAEMRLGGFAENSWNLVKAVLTESWLLKAHCSPWLSWPHAFDIGVLSRPAWALAFCRGRTPSAGWFSLLLLCIFDDMYCIYVTQLYLCMPH